MTIKQIKDSLKKQITSGQHSSIFNKLRTQIIGQDLERKLRLIETRFQDLEDQNLKGILSEEKYQISRNKINDDLLKLIDSISIKDIKTPVNKKSKKAKITNKDTFLKQLRIHGKKRELASQTGAFTYKREFIKITKEIENIISEYSKNGKYKYKKVKVKDGLEFYIADAIIVISFCERFLFVGARGDKSEKSEYNIKEPELLTLTINEVEEIVWEKNDVMGKKKEGLYTSYDVADELVTNVFLWLMNQKIKFHL